MNRLNFRNFWLLPACFCILCLLQHSAMAAPAQERTVIDLDAGWKFIREDVSDAKTAAFNDAAWTDVNLPHTWNAQDGQTNDGSGKYYRGPGWYRRHLKLDSSQAGKSLFLKFDGASIVSEVYVNGQLVGMHAGMFGAFCLDVSSLIKPGDNVIAVRVDNTFNKNVPPLTADFTFFGGIYRDVSLLVLDPVCISPLDDASSGVYLKQTSVTADKAELDVTTKLLNRSGKLISNAAVLCEVMDAAGQVVASTRTAIPLAGGVGGGGAAPSTQPANVFMDAQQHITIDHPHLWNARKDPYLYTARVTLFNGDKAVDQINQPLGLRFFKVDPDTGFWLNGQPYRLYGVNRHQDRVDKGWAIGTAEHEEDFRLIMEMGCTAIRLAHYEHAQAFYNLCDRGGLVVWAEMGLVNSVTEAQDFDDNAKQQLRELIKQNYNHPSICFWSLFNELGNGSGSGKGQVQHQVDLVAALNAEVKSLDTTRLTTGATVRPMKHPLNQITDVLAWNRYPGWYGGKLTDWPKLCDSFHAEVPQRCLGISEYGAGANINQHELDVQEPKATGNWHPEEWQCLIHEQAWEAMQQRKWLWGTFAWNMFDFASQGRREGGIGGRNDKGLVTYDRKTRKDAFYFYKANWSDESFAYITDRRFTPRKALVQPIKIYSNCDSVELKVDGQSLGTQRPNDIHIFVWPNVDMKLGERHLEAIGSKDGKTFNDECTIECKEMGLTQPATAPATRPATKPAKAHTANKSEKNTP